MRTLNLGILAHVDAGKTTLSERLLYTAGAIDHVGSVDAGTTQTDSLDLERERGITIRSAVASFLVGDLAVNLVDTPGHPDFIAEVERVLARARWGGPRRLGGRGRPAPDATALPRAPAASRPDADLRQQDRSRRRRRRSASSRRWSAGSSPAIVPMESRPGAGQPGGDRHAVRSRRRGPSDGAHRGPRRARRGDPPGLRRRRGRRCPAAHLRERARRPDSSWARPSGLLRLGRARDRRRRAPRRGRGAPGRRRMAIRTRPCRVASSRSSGRPRGERVAYARLFAGTLRAAPACRRRRGRGRQGDARSGSSHRRARHVARSSSAGEMATIRGLGAVRVGDAIGEPRPGDEATARFPRPTLEAVVFARKPEAAGFAPGGSRPARRAGSAHRRPPGRRPARDRGVALRRGPEGGHPGDARARLRHRRRLPRDDHGLHRAAGAGRRGGGGHPGEDQDEHHRSELAAQHEPVPGDAGPADRAGAIGSGIDVPPRGRAPPHPAVPVQDAPT